jgi:hypothetical protein
MKRLALALIFLLAFSSPAWARPAKWKKTEYLVKDEVLDDALVRAKAKALGEYEAMERARARVGSKFKAMEEARAKAAKPAPMLPH